MISYGGDYVEILKGMVRDAGYPDEECNYVKIDDNTIYYFIKDYKLKNGNIIATNILKEAIGHAPYTSLGVIDQNDGKILIPFENKTINQIKDNLLLVEKNVPTTKSVVDALKNKSDPFAAQTLAENASKIKQQLKDIMGMNGDFIFDNQFSEAAIYTMDGVNVAGDYFSFIGENNGDYYLATNVFGATIMKFNPEQLQQTSSSSNTVEQESDNSDIQGGVQSGYTPEVQLNDNTNDDLNNNLTPNIDIPDQNMENQDQEMKKSDTTLQDDNVGIQEEFQDKNVSEQPPKVSEDNNEEMKLNLPMDSNDEPKEETSGDEVSKSKDIEERSFDDTNIDTVTVSEENNESTDGKEESEAKSLDNDTIEDETEVSDNENLENAEKSETNTFDEDVSGNVPVETHEDETSSALNEGQEEENNTKTYSLTDEDIATPTIKDATNTIRNLLEENRKQRRIIDKQIGEIEALKTNTDILREENFSQEQEITSLRDEMNSYRGQAINLTRENAKLTGTLERQNDIMKKLEEQNTGLRNQVAGMHALSDAIVEANALVQPVDDTSTNYYGSANTKQNTFTSSNLNIDNYLNGNYNENNFDYLGDSHDDNTNNLDQSYQKSKVA